MRISRQMQSTPSYGSVSTCKLNAGWFEVSQSHQHVHTSHYRSAACRCEHHLSFVTLGPWKKWVLANRLKGGRTETSAHLHQINFIVFILLINNVIHPALTLVEFSFSPVRSSCRTFEVLKCVEIYVGYFFVCLFCRKEADQNEPFTNRQPVWPDQLWLVCLFSVSSTLLRASTKSSGHLDASRLSRLGVTMETRVQKWSCLEKGTAWRTNGEHSGGRVSTRAAVACLHHHLEIHWCVCVSCINVHQHKRLKVNKVQSV